MYSYHCGHISNHILGEKILIYDRHIKTAFIILIFANLNITIILYSVYSRGDVFAVLLHEREVRVLCKLFHPSVTLFYLYLNLLLFLTEVTLTFDL